MQIQYDHKYVQQIDKTCGGEKDRKEMYQGVPRKPQAVTQWVISFSFDVCVSPNIL